MMPEYLVTVLPISLLLALLYTLTHLARHNEITAMRAAGVNLWRICVPYFLVGCFASIASFALNEFCVPRSTDWADHILNRYVPIRMTRRRNRSSRLISTRAPAALWKFTEYHPKTAEMIGPKVGWTAGRLMAANCGGPRRSHQRRVDFFPT